MNQLYQGDNLAILREMPDASVDLICTDPPFNTGKDWGAFNDKWEGGLKGYLKFMEARCVEMRRVLKNTGSLYLHCDPTASHYLKVMLDGVFGIKQFRNEIVWHYRRWSVPCNRWQRMHDVIYFYTISDQNYFESPLQDYAYCQPDMVVRKKVNGKTARVRDKDGNQVRYSAPKRNGVLMHDVWRDINLIAPTAKERLGYPTQKPVALYERMIKASSNQHDTVLDPFAGSGTTLDAAQSLGRRWIGIDQSEEAISVIQKRMEARHGMLLKYELIQHETSLTDNG